MIRFELVKIFKSKLNIIAMLLGLVLILVVFIGQNFGSDSIYCEETNSYLKGMAGLEYSKEKAALQGEFLTEEMVTDYLKKVQGYEGNLNSDEAYTDLIRKDGALFYYLYYSYADINPKYDFNELKELDLSNGAGFYKRRLEKIADYLNMDFSFGNYSENEKEFWMSKAKHVTTPFAWASKVSATRFYDLNSMGFYFIFIVIVCIAPMFSKESDTGAVQLLLTTKRGKTGLVNAKIIASMIFAVGYILFCQLLSVILQATVSGFDGMKLPVQLFGNVIPYEMKIWQLCLLSLCVILVIAITIVAIMLLLSALTKNSIGTMSVALLLMVVPAFIPYSKESRLLNRFVDLTFVKMANLKEIMERFVSYRLGSVILDQITMCVIVWMLIAVICLIPVRKVFVNRIIK